MFYIHINCGYSYNFDSQSLVETVVFMQQLKAWPTYFAPGLGPHR